MTASSMSSFVYFGSSIGDTASSLSSQSVQVAEDCDADCDADSSYAQETWNMFVNWVDEAEERLIQITQRTRRFQIIDLEDIPNAFATLSSLRRIEKLRKEALLVFSCRGR